MLRGGRGEEAGEVKRPPSHSAQVPPCRAKQRAARTASRPRAQVLVPWSGRVGQGCTSP